MTNKKTLLGEGTVRQFMKLANIGPPLTADFVGRLYEGDKVEEDKVEEDKVEEDKVEEDKVEARQEGKTLKETGDGEDSVNEQEELEAEEEVELGAPEEGPPELGDLEDEEPGLDAPEATGDVDVTALVQAIADAVEEHTGVSVEVAGSEGEEAGDLDFGEEAEETEVDLEGPGGEEVEASEEEGPVELEEVISTIAENVTKRLAVMTKKKK